MNITINYIDFERICEVTKIYCPNCSDQNVFVEIREGDYYVGQTHFCLSCNEVFTIQQEGTRKFKVLE